jgi:hypothetical protein
MFRNNLISNLYKFALILKLEKSKYSEVNIDLAHVNNMSSIIVDDKEIN